MEKLILIKLLWESVLSFTDAAWFADWADILRAGKAYEWSYMDRARRTAAPTAPTHLIPTMYCVKWDDVFLILNTVSYEHKSLILDKPFNCLLKCLWKVVGEGSKGQGTPQMHWLDVGRVGGLAGSAGSLPELAEGKAGLHPGQLCHVRAHRYPAFWIDGWFFSLLPPLLWLEVLLLLPRTDEKFRKYF